MKKIFSMAMASLFVMSCANTYKEVAETSEPTTITWIEDKPGPTLHDHKIFPTVTDSLWQAYQDNIKLFEAGDKLACGVRTIDAYGHTPGHTVFQKDSILVIADLMHGAALQLEHPEYCPFFDMNPEDTTASRERILEYAKQNNLTMYGMHISEGVVK